MNKELYGKQYDIPPQTIQHLKKYEANETVNNLLSTGKASYSLLKKIKHRMENGEKDSLGGDHMINWVNHTLNSDRGGINISKDAKKEAGVQNTHIAPHQKNNLNTMNRPSKSHSSFTSDIKITENLKRINEIISKLL